jgi:hypothetical protein
VQDDGRLDLNDAEAAAAPRPIRRREADGDIEKAHVKRFDVRGYPTLVLGIQNGKTLKSISAISRRCKFWRS